MIVREWHNFAAKKMNQQAQTKSFDRFFPQKIICFMYTYLHCFIAKVIFLFSFNFDILCANCSQ